MGAVPSRQHSPACFQPVMKPTTVLQGNRNIIFSHLGMNGDNMEALEHLFGSEAELVNSKSLDRLARILECGQPSLKRNHQPTIYFACRVLVHFFKSSRALRNLERLLEKGASSFPQQPILVQLMQKLGNIPAKNPIQTSELPPAVGPQALRTEDSSELSDRGDTTDSVIHIEIFVSQDYTVPLGSGVQAKIRALESVEPITPSFEEWFDKLLGIGKGTTSVRQPSPSSIMYHRFVPSLSPLPSVVGAPSSRNDHGSSKRKSSKEPTILRRYASAMVHWALEKYRDVSTLEEARLRSMLLFAAGNLLEKCSEKEKRDYVLASLADILVADLELLHANLHFIKNKRLMEEVGRRIIPLAYIKTNEAFLQEEPHMFLLFMQLVCLENDILLDDEDLYLLSELEGAKQFPFWDYDEQLRTHGICVQLCKKEAKEGPVDGAMSFLYGENQFLIHVQPNRLSALGFSILCFILIPNDKTQKALLALVGLTESFTNCFVKHFKEDGKHVLDDEMGSEKFREMIDELHREDEGDTHHSKIFVPLGWTYKLNLSNAFLRVHGTVGSVGILLGNDVTHITPINPLPDEGTPSPSSLFDAVKHLVNPRYKLGKSHVPNENVFVDNYKLVYQQPAKRPFRLKSLNFGAGLSCFTANAEVEPTNQWEPIKTSFLTLAQFVTFDFRHSRKAGMITRLTWLETALMNCNVFLAGKNQSLLESVFCHDVCILDREEILERDCRIKHERLQRQSRPLPFKVQRLLRGEEGPSSNIVFFVDQVTEGTGAENVYKAPFEVVHKDHSSNAEVDGIRLTGRCERATPEDQDDLNNAQILDMDLI